MALSIKSALIFTKIHFLPQDNNARGIKKIITLGNTFIVIKKSIFMRNSYVIFLTVIFISGDTTHQKANSINERRSAPAARLQDKLRSVQQ